MKQVLASIFGARLGILVLIVILKSSREEEHEMTNPRNSLKLVFFIFLCVLWFVPLWEYLFSGFRQLGYNFYDMSKAIIMLMWFSIFYYKFKKFNITKKLISFFLMVYLQTLLPQKWDVNLSAGFIPDMVIVVLSLGGAILYYRKVIKGKIDGNGNTISSEEI